MPRPKRQLKRAAARDTQDAGQARRPGRRRAQRQQTNNIEQDVQAQLAPPQPHSIQLPQAAPQHQAALLQQAAPPQQAQDQAENQPPSRTKRPERESSSLVTIILLSTGGVITLALLMLIGGAIRRFHFITNVNENDH